MTHLVLPSVPSAVYRPPHPVAQSQPQSLPQQVKAPQHTATPGSSSSSSGTSPPSIFMPKRSMHSSPTVSRQRRPFSHLSSDELAQQAHAIQVELVQTDDASRRCDLERHLGMIHSELELRSKPAQPPHPSTSTSNRVVMLSPQEVNAIDQHHQDWARSHQPQLSDYAPTPPATPSKRRVVRKQRSKGSLQDIIGWADSLDRSNTSAPKSGGRRADKSAYNLARPSWWSEAMGVDPNDLDEAETDEFGRALEEDYLEDDDTLLRQVEDHRA